ncbi:MAG: hypothetical protein LBV54_02405 [Puniceicoccales bacterium]|nr:hypothetical protein [Puniceicoccales bacterium]
MRLFLPLFFAFLALIPARALNASELSESFSDIFHRGYNAARLEVALAANDDNAALSSLLNSLPEVHDTSPSLETTCARIRTLTAHMDKASPALKSMLAIIIAEISDRYSRGNRRDLNTTERRQNTSEDFLGWDSIRLHKKIFSLCEIALADPALLQRTPVTAFDSVLRTGDTPNDSLRPTLYDFIAHRVIKRYSLKNYENDASDLADDESPWALFDPDANSPLLGTLKEFLDWNPAAELEISGDAVPALLRAVALYQELLRFRLADTASPTALADADLSRILWAKEILPDDKHTRTRFQQALRACATRFEKCTPAAAALAELAYDINERAEHYWEFLDAPSVPVPLDALKIAEQGRALHPDSAGGRRCAAIIAGIQDPELKRITTETVWNAPLPGITIRYRNLSKVHFRIVPADWKETLEYRVSQRPESPGAAKFTALLKSTPAQAWSTELPATPDHAIRAHTVAAPGGLTPGFYHLLASATGDFSTKGNTILHDTFWVSDLALVFDANPNTKTDSVSDYQVQGHVLNAVTGVPVSGATVSAWHRQQREERNQEQERKQEEDEESTYPDIRGIPRGRDNRDSIPLSSAITDADGSFAIALPDDAADIVLFAEARDGQCLSVASEIRSSRKEKLDENQIHFRFFTDRAIYRPGQTLHFKGVALSANHRTKTYTPIPSVPRTVLLKDPNHKESARLTLIPDSIGSFSGSFVLPHGKLTGHYTLTTDEKNCYDGVGISVEEYKRPKFEVTLNAPEFLQTAERNVTLSGTAHSTNGFPVDGAQVKWKVHANTYSRSKKTIAHGTASTDSAGNFTLTFRASRKTVHVSRLDFDVVVEVTDSIGETRDATRTIASEAPAPNVEIYVDEWQEAGRPVLLFISGTLPQLAAAGTLTIHPLRQPEKVLRKSAENFHGFLNNLCAEKDPADPDNWERLPAVFTAPFALDANGRTTAQANLPEGIYRAVFTTKTSIGDIVRGEKRFNVYALAAPKSAIRLPFMVTVQKLTLQPGDTFSALWSSGYTSVRALVSIEHQGKILQRFWTNPECTQEHITMPVTESLRGGFTLHVLQMCENRFYHESHVVDVPWENKKLEISTERFRTRLTPGARETWTLKIKPVQAGNSAPASSPFQLAAALYDASLDAFGAHTWRGLDSIFYSETQLGAYSLQQQELLRESDTAVQNLVDTSKRFSVWCRDEYREWDHSFHPLLLLSSFGGRSIVTLFGSAGGGESVPAGFAGDKDTAALTAIVPRKNLTETAFFFPSLLAEPDGTVRIEFTMPESLTRWKFLAFAHDAALRSGAIYNDTITTSKDFMVQPNTPRFVREGDTLELTVKLTNKSTAPQSGRVRLNFTDALNLASADARLANTTPERAFTLAPRSSQSLAWRIRVPDGQGYLIYKAVATAGLLTDGEEGFLPVLSRRQLVTESLTFSATGNAGLRPASNSESETRAPSASRTFRFEKLLASAADPTLRHESLTVQMFSNPAWSAVMALPYLMEFPYECSEQLFSRYYANALARHIANADPKIASVFAQWKNTPALESPLFKNEDLKTILIEETPWVRAAESESAQRRNIGILFDKKRTDTELTAAFKKLSERQLSSGGWSWFPGGPADGYITRHIIAGFGKLQHLGIEKDSWLTTSTLLYLDGWLSAELRRIKADATRRATDYRKENHLSSDIAHHLYSRSFFTKSAIAAEHVEAYAYFTEQALAHWQKLPLQSQAHVALALHRTGSAVPATILRSLRERAKSDPDLGAFWSENAASRSWYWHEAPIETHALLIEAFSEIAPEPAFLNELQTWLLKQKQAQSWPTTKATTDAIYALLLQAAAQDSKPAPIPLLASDALVSIKLGAHSVVPRNVVPGTGFYVERIAAPAIVPGMGKITVSKATPGVAWGSVTWQYFQDIGKITPHDKTPLKLKKTLWKQVLTKSGKALVSVSQSKVNPGDTLIVRLELRTDRDMEFMHLKDQHGSGTEPVNVLSGYRWRDGLGYYESTKDTATHFFIDWLPAGTHIFEYPVRVQLRGAYPSGIAEIQCMYAPEFNAHSESIPLVVD